MTLIVSGLNLLHYLKVSDLAIASSLFSSIHWSSVAAFYSPTHKLWATLI